MNEKEFEKEIRDMAETLGSEDIDDLQLLSDIDERDGYGSDLENAMLVSYSLSKRRIPHKCYYVVDKNLPSSVEKWMKRNGEAKNFVVAIRRRFYIIDTFHKDVGVRVFNTMNEVYQFMWKASRVQNCEICEWTPLPFKNSLTMDTLGEVFSGSFEDKIYSIYASSLNHVLDAGKGITYLNFIDKSLGFGSNYEMAMHLSFRLYKEGITHKCYMIRENAPLEDKAARRANRLAKMVIVAVEMDEMNKPISYLWIDPIHKRSLGVHKYTDTEVMFSSMTKRLRVKNCSIIEWVPVGYCPYGYISYIGTRYDSSFFDDKIRSMYDSLKNHGRMHTREMIRPEEFMNSMYGTDMNFVSFMYSNLSVEKHCYFLRGSEGNAYVFVAVSPGKRYYWISLTKNRGIHPFSTLDSLFSAVAKSYHLGSISCLEYVPFFSKESSIEESLERTGGNIEPCRENKRKTVVRGSINDEQ